MKNNHVRLVCLMVLGLFVLTSPVWGGGSQESGSAGAAAAYPSRPVNILVPAAPGGDTDFNARITARYLEQQLGQSFPVVNNAGRSGLDAARQLMSAPADGYLLYYWFTGSFSIAIASGLVDDDLLNNFDIVCCPNQRVPDVLAVRADFPVNTIKEFIEYSKTHQVNWAINVGSTPHFHGIVMNNVYGAKLNFVASGNAVQRIAGLLGGTVDAIPVAYGVVRDYVEQTKEIKLICTLGEKRDWYLPNVPTAVEQGYDKLYLLSRDVLYVRKGTDPAILKKLADAHEKTVKIPSFAEEIKKAYYQEPFFLRDEEAKQFIAKEHARYMEYSQYFKQK